MFDEFMMPPPGDEEMEFLPVLTDEEEDDVRDQEFGDTMPILALRNTILFPGVMLPITVGRERSVKAVNAAYKKDKIIAVIGQKDPAVEDPNIEELYSIGTVAKIVKKLKMPDGSTTVIIQGKKRCSLTEILSEEPYLKAKVEILTDEKPKIDKGFSALMSSMKDSAADIIKFSPAIPSEAAIILKNINGPIFLTHFIVSNLSVDVVKKQSILEIDDIKERANVALEFVNEELQLLELKNQIQSKVKGDIDKQQRDYFLHQQMKKIQEELGGDSVDKEIQRLKDRAKKAKWGKEISKVFDKEIKKLERTNPAAAEYSVLLNYCELMLDLPWGVYTKDSFDLKNAKKVLDKDHYGLDKVKDRILEYLAVLKLKGNMKSPILCLAGPPGVGKTSLGRSIARALKRKYVRMSLGGLHDESEIRGHRKTYIGAMPGRIIQSLKKAKASNPVFILDEIDKVGTDFRGDPSSALLEVLDPEQNHSFYDNYLELEYDLSKVMFIATANSLSSIQPALRDRLEIIYVDGYSVEEKVEIGKQHLVPKQREAHGLKSKDVKITPKILEKIVEDFTRESGVRELDRTLASVMRSVAKSVVMDENKNATINAERLEEILGKAKYDKNISNEKNPPGVAIGLAYTRVGGDILFIESSLSKGKGVLTLTGSLGDVMKESATTALSYLKSHAEDVGIDSDVFEKLNVHIHVPEGATPKDGPSAGITILSALASVFTQRKIKQNLAMTGEITLRGKVLPVGGIKEKILAAKRAGVKEIIMCRQNQKDVEEINNDFIKNLKFNYVDRMEEVLELALEKRKIKNPIDLDLLIAANN